MTTTLAMILGRKKMGKSTLLRTIVLEHLTAYEHARFHVWDTTREWARIPGARGMDRLFIYPGHQYDLDDVLENAIDDAPCVAVIDEIDRVAPNHAGGLMVDTPLHSIVHYGRHLSVGLLCATRRAARVHCDLMALSDTIYFFHLSHPRDIVSVAEHCGPVWADTVRRLHPHERVRFDP